jgi:integration host factor subunit beta
MRSGFFAAFGTKHLQDRCNNENFLPACMIIVKRCKAKSDKRVASYEITVREGHNMIRSELIKKLEAENPELKTEEIEKIVDLFFDQIIQRLSDGGRVELRGFGAFSTRDRSPRKGRNPRTGASVDVPSKRVPYFKPGKEVRESLNK